MKLKEINNGIKKAKNSRELLTIINKVLKGGITEINDLKVKKDRIGIGIFFSKNGDRIYFVGNKEIHEYALSVPFDWRTGSYVGKIEWTKASEIKEG